MATAGEARRKARSGARGLALIGVKLAISSLLIIWLVSRIGLVPLLEVIASARPHLLLAAGGFLVGSHLIGSWQWGRLLYFSGAPLAPGRVIAYYFAGAFGNLVLPTGAGGDVARIIGVARERGKAEAVLGATLLDRLLGLGVIGLLALVALRGAGGLAGAPGGSWVVAAVVVNAALSCGVLALVLSPWGGSLLAAAGRRLPVAVGERLARLSEALARVRATPRWGLLALAATAVQSLRILAHYQVARALDIDVGVGYFFLFVPLLAVAVSLPVSIGGIGVRESMGAFLFGLIAVKPAMGSGMQLLAYIVAISVSMPGALVLLAGWSRSRADRGRPVGREAGPAAEGEPGS